MYVENVTRFAFKCTYSTSWSALDGFLAAIRSFEDFDHESPLFYAVFLVHVRGDMVEVSFKDFRFQRFKHRCSRFHTFASQRFFQTLARLISREFFFSLRLLACSNDESFSIFVQDVPVLPTEKCLSLLLKGRVTIIKAMLLLQMFFVTDRLQYLAPFLDFWRSAKLCCAPLLPSVFRFFGVATHAAVFLRLPLQSVSGRLLFDALEPDAPGTCNLWRNSPYHASWEEASRRLSLYLRIQNIFPCRLDETLFNHAL